MNQTIMQYFEWDLPSTSRLWKQLATQAEHLHNLGITALWLPPAYKDAYGKEGVGYAVYDMYDLGEFDQKGSISTKYGTKEEYLSAIDSCHRAGLCVYADIVFNHRIGADSTEEIWAYECNAANRNEVAKEKKCIEGWTNFSFPGRKKKYSSFTWHARHFDGIDWDESQKRNSIYLIEGKNWDNQVDGQNGNYDYLMGADVDFDNEEVKKELLSFSKWYYDVTRVDGFRLDALKHISSHFFRLWMVEMKKYIGQDFFVVGEYWNGDLGELCSYLARTEHQISLFDVPLHFRFYEAAKQRERFDLRTIFDQTLVNASPLHAVTFVDNHDTQPGQALSSFVEPWFKPLAYALILLRSQGTACVFYGDYYGIEAKGISPNQKLLGNLISIRNTHAYGEQRDYFDERNCIGFVREGMEDAALGLSYENSSLACVLSNGNSNAKRMYIGQMHAGQKYFDVTFHQKQILTIDRDGYGIFPVGRESVSVWIPI